MITDVPTEADFHGSAARFLEAAWSEAIERIETEKYEKESRREEEEEESIFSEESSLAISYIALYTGVEHILRASITAVSPFLLLVGDPSKWPKSSGSKGVPFADFRTIDAQDLIRVYETVCSSRLSEAFKEKYNSLRRERNSLIHSYSRTKKVVVKDLIETIFFATDALVGPRTWLDWRRKMLIAADERDQYNSWEWLMTREFGLVLGVMGEAAARKHLGIDKKRRRYYCPACIDSRTRQERKGGAYESIEGLAQLDKNDRHLLHCIVCETDSRVEREKCPDSSRCKGDVISGELCMTCAR